MDDPQNWEYSQAVEASLTTEDAEKAEASQTVGYSQADDSQMAEASQTVGDSQADDSQMDADGSQIDEEGRRC